jgi:uncharacterized protein YyaL (SSP411 family)
MPPFLNIRTKAPWRNERETMSENKEKWAEQMILKMTVCALKDQNQQLVDALEKLARECDGDALGTVKAPNWETLCQIETLLHKVKA